MKPARKMDQAMGEARVEVKLTNLFDWEKAEEGKLKTSRVRSITAKATVDPGAVRCVLPPAVVRRLGLKPRRKQVVEYTDGRKEEVGVVSGVIFEILARDAEEDAFVLGDEVLIGQTVLERMDLLVDCRRGCVVPNPAHPDQPVNKLR